MTERSRAVLSDRGFAIARVTMRGSDALVLETGPHDEDASERELPLSRDEALRLGAALVGLIAGEGAEAVVLERFAQVVREGYDAAHDDAHEAGELALAALAYATPPGLRVCVGVGPPGGFVGYDAWPWDAASDKRAEHTYRRRLEIAGALIAAEWDRLERSKRELGMPANRPGAP